MKVGSIFGSNGGLRPVSREGQCWCGMAERTTEDFLERAERIG